MLTVYGFAGLPLMSLAWFSRAFSAALFMLSSPLGNESITALYTVVLMMDILSKGQTEEWWQLRSFVMPTWQRQPACL